MVQKSVYHVFQNIGSGITPAVKRGFLPVNLHADICTKTSHFLKD